MEDFNKIIEFFGEERLANLFKQMNNEINEADYVTPKFALNPSGAQINSLNDFYGIKPFKNNVFFIYAESFYKKEINSTYVAAFSVNRKGKILNWKSCLDHHYVPNNSFDNKTNELISKGKRNAASGLIMQLKANPKGITN